ncbi:hypothetical protein SASPL_118203 [Salvia splendens]|uniref:Uncharacterized protein n=1 Tax=Salvia splendens TaxID=180675 RepID=A0A8X8ZYX3_SALSN|nr:hypothetical protein SASPL_118203 [Salvia splendens]
MDRRGRGRESRRRRAQQRCPPAAFTSLQRESSLWGGTAEEAEPATTPGASPEEYVRAYQTYQRCYGDSLGEFLAHYQRLWWDAAFHGSVTRYDGIVRLLSLLPDGWKEWATMVADKYIVTAYPACDLVGDFPRFLLAVFTRFVCYGSVSPLLIDSPRPEVQDPPAPMEPGRPSQWESEAGPSRRPVESRTPRAPPARPPSMRDPTFPMEAEREAQEAARKGKALAADSEEDEEEGPPVVAPVGSSRLQAITVPSRYMHIRSATEVDHPDMGRRMVRVDAIWPHLRKAENEAAPPALTEESVEDPHLLWEWACGEDEDNPILVNSDEERRPKEGAHRIVTATVMISGTVATTPLRESTKLTLDHSKGMWQDPVRVLDATGCMEAPARQGLIPVSTAGKLDILLRTIQAGTQGQE